MSRRSGPVSPVEFVRRRLDGTQEIDEWGLDPDVIDLVAPLAGLRWDVEVQWPERLPYMGPAVLVHNRALGLSEPVVLARGVRQMIGRHVRTAGLVDLPPFATIGRMLGAVVDRPEELTGLLRDGHLVALPLGRDVRSGRAGGLPTSALAPVLATAAPVVPVALVGREPGRHWRLLVGEPIASTPGRGPLAVADLADAARAAVQELLDSARGPVVGLR